jgi:hypothetical protein
MYQNLTHYQSMLKEIEQHNNKPISTIPENPQPMAYPQKEERSRLAEGESLYGASSFQQNHEQKFLKESPSKEYLRFGNNVNESTLSNWRQESAQRFRLPEKSHSPARESYHQNFGSGDQSFQNRSKQSMLRESNQENIPTAAAAEVNWPSQNAEDNGQALKGYLQEERSFQGESSYLPKPKEQPRFDD